MNSRRLSTDELELQRTRLRQFLIWLIPIAFVFTGVYGIAFAIFRIPAIAIVGLLCGLFGATLLVAWAMLRRKHLTAAVNITCASLLLLALSGAVAFPAISAVLTIIALVTVVVALPYVSGRVLLSLIGATLATVVAVLLLGEFVQLLPPLPTQLTQVIRVSATTAAAALLLLLLWQFSARLNETLQQTRAANTALQAAQADLEAQVAARTAALRTALNEVETRSVEQERLLLENTRQREMIRDLSMPVLPISASTLVMPLVGALDGERLQQMQQQALRAVERSSAHRLLLDITGAPLVDTVVAQGLISVTRAVRLLGAEVALVGIRPDVAQTIVGLGVDLRGIQTFTDLQTALDHTVFNGSSRHTPQKPRHTPVSHKR
jgi:rsbT co-antagonist protein RsbR